MKPLQWPEPIRSRMEDSQNWGEMAVQFAWPQIQDDIAKELATRSKIDSLAWGDDPNRRRIAQVLCSRIQWTYEWPNDLFLPADPFDIACLIPWDDLEVNELVMDLEEDLGIKLTDDEVSGWVGKTLSDVVDSLIRYERDTLLRPALQDQATE